MDDAPKPLLAICACTARKVPAAHEGGFEASKLAVSCASWPCTVASVDGDVSAACICSAYVEAVSALALGVINSFACICLCTGFCSCVAVPWAACKLDTALWFCWAGLTWACWLTIPWAASIVVVAFLISGATCDASVWAAVVSVGAVVWVAYACAGGLASTTPVTCPLVVETFCSGVIGVSAATVAPPIGKVGANACCVLNSSILGVVVLVVFVFWVSPPVCSLTTPPRAISCALALYTIISRSLSGFCLR